MSLLTCNYRYLNNEIQSWFEQLSSVAAARIPRCIRLVLSVKASKVITFVDASIRAFGAAVLVYTRFEYEQPYPSRYQLLASKSKVAPLAPVTAPLLELMAAITRLRLTQAIIQVMEIPMSAVTFCSDSLDALSWI